MTLVDRILIVTCIAEAALLFFCMWVEACAVDVPDEWDI
jgi:hypothetical protein